MEKLVTKKVVVNIEHIEPNPWNPNRMGDFLYQQMKKTIQEKGLFGSIFVRPIAGVYQVLDGEHRLKVCKELGWKEVPVECTEEITDEQAKFWTIYFNNTRGQDDVEKRANLLKEMNSGQQSLLPFTTQEIENEIKLFNFDFSQYDEQKEITRQVNSTLCIGLTDEERRLWDETLRIAKQEKKDEVKLLMSMIENYLELRVQRNDKGEWMFK